MGFNNMLQNNNIQMNNNMGFNNMLQNNNIQTNNNMTFNNMLQNNNIQTNNNMNMNSNSINNNSTDNSSHGSITNNRSNNSNTNDNINNNDSSNNNNQKKIFLLFQKNGVPYKIFCYPNDKFEVAIKIYRKCSGDNSYNNFFLDKQQIINYKATIDELKLKDNSYITVKA